MTPVVPPPRAQVCQNYARHYPILHAYHAHPKLVVFWCYAGLLDGKPRYAFDTAAGRWSVLLLASAGQVTVAPIRYALVAHYDFTDDGAACLFGVTINPDDVRTERIAPALPGIRWFLLYDLVISTAYSAVMEQDGNTAYTPHWLLLDTILCVHTRGTHAAAPVSDTVLVVIVFPLNLCQHLIDPYETHDSQKSGFMRQLNGAATMVYDPTHKRRTDHMIEDQTLIDALKAHLLLVLTPMIRHAFQFNSTRIERRIVVRYDAKQSKDCRTHRDNTTADRASSIRRYDQFQREDYEGGNFRLSEFGKHNNRAPTGSAVVFSSSLLYEASPVRTGRHYAFLPSLYNHAGTQLRERNLARVAPELQSYRSGLPAR